MAGEGGQRASLKEEWNVTGLQLSLPRGAARKWSAWIQFCHLPTPLGSEKVPSIPKIEEIGLNNCAPFQS